MLDHNQLKVVIKVKTCKDILKYIHTYRHKQN